MYLCRPCGLSFLFCKTCTHVLCVFHGHADPVKLQLWGQTGCKINPGLIVMVRPCHPDQCWLSFSCWACHLFRTISCHFMPYCLIASQLIPSNHIISHHDSSSYHIASLSCSFWYHIMSCHVLSCHVMSCHATCRCIFRSYSLLGSLLSLSSFLFLPLPSAIYMPMLFSWSHPCHSIPHHIIPCHLISSHLMPCHVMSYHIMSCHVMCHIM